MNPAPLPPIPLETAKAAQAVFGISNFYLAVGDQTSHLFDGLSLADASGRMRKSPQNLATLYLITIFQFVETLPDQHAAGALRERLDWKYALHLPLNNPGFDARTICEFRQWLLVEQGGQKNLQSLLSRISKVTDFAVVQWSGLEPEQAIATVCQISRITIVWEAFNQALQAVATHCPDWLLTASRPHWYQRYGHHHKNLNLGNDSKEQQSLAQSIGLDGDYLLQAISDSNLPSLDDLPEVFALKQVWREQYWHGEEKIVWRKEACAGCTSTIRRLYQLEQ